MANRKNPAHTIFETIQDDVIGIMNSVNWDVKGLTPEENIQLIEVHGALKNLDKKLKGILDAK